MTWGGGSWGADEWGDPGAPVLSIVGPAIADVLGGTVLTLYGSNFFDPALVELVLGVTTVGRAEYLEARLDLRRRKLIVGLPALPAGVYSVRITTTYGTSLLPDCVTYKPFADQMKIQRARRRWAPAWAVGPKLLV